MRNFGKAVIWPFKAKETKDSLERLSRLRELLGTALAVDSSMMLRSVHQDTKQISAGVQELTDRATMVDDREERQLLFKWLEPNSANAEDNLNEGLKQHHPGTGEWLRETDAYLSWSQGPSSLLWIHGIREQSMAALLIFNNVANSAGSGKTVLASSIIQSLLGAKEPGTEVLYFFCDHRDSAKRTAKNFLGLVLMRLLSLRPELVADAKGLFHKSGSDPSNAAGTEDLLNLLAMSIRILDSVTIVIDALDECKELEDFTAVLQTILDTEAGTVRILVTSRPDFALRRALEHLTNYNISLDQNVQRDINSFIASEVDARIAKRQIKIRSPELRALIKRALHSRAQGMFLWVKFQLDLIEKLNTDKAIREALNELPKGLDETYLRLLEQIKERNAHDLGTVCKLLICILSCLTPLTLGQLVEIISIEPGDTKRDLDKMVTDPDDLLETLGCLVVVDRSQDDPVVTVAHYTVDEFLRSDSLFRHETLSMFYVPTTGVVELGLIFAQYMSFSEFREPCRTEAELLGRITSYKLLDMVSSGCFAQMRSYGCRGPLSKRQISILQWFIEPNGNFVSWQQVLHGRVSELPPTNPLLYAARFGMLNFFDIMIQRGADAQVLFREGYDPLAVAVIAGQEGLVSSVLQANPMVDLEKMHSRGATYLHLAAGTGSEKVVKLLLEAGASPDARSSSESTPFYRAARSGSIPTMELLLDAGSDVNAETWDGWTAIIEAMENQHVEAVLWLVRNGANLRQKMYGGVSVLMFAQGTGNKKIVQIIEEGLQSC